MRRDGIAHPGAQTGRKARKKAVCGAAWRVDALCAWAWFRERLAQCREACVLKLTESNLHRIQKTQKVVQWYR